MKILEELWSGNIRPIERNPFENDRFAKLVKLSRSNKEKLDTLLSDEAKEILDIFMESQSELSSISQCDEFISGFCLGTRIMIEVMMETEDFFTTKV
ncbi:MAG: hypothetical protein J1E39_03170 [Eubacterium sp.]|nr:hypothetical protein [Eubacterium sp.]